MRKKELLTRIEALERQVASQSTTIEQLRLSHMKYGPVVQPSQPIPQVPPFWLSPKAVCGEAQ